MKPRCDVQHNVVVVVTEVGEAFSRIAIWSESTHSVPRIQGCTPSANSVRPWELHASKLNIIGNQRHYIVLALMAALPTLA